MKFTVEIGGTAEGKIDELTAEVYGWRDDTENDAHKEACHANKEEEEAGEVHQVSAFWFVTEGNQQRTQ